MPTFEKKRSSFIFVRKILPDHSATPREQYSSVSLGRFLDDLPVKRYTPELALTASYEKYRYILKIFCLNFSAWTYVFWLLQNNSSLKLNIYFQNLASSCILQAKLSHVLFTYYKYESNFLFNKLIILSPIVSCLHAFTSEVKYFT